MGRLTRKVGLVAVGRAANAMAIYAVYALAARTWDKVQCEVFAALWVLSNALVPIFLIGLPTAVLYFFPLRKDTRRLALQAGSAALLSALCLGAILYGAGIELFAVLNGREGLPPGMEAPLVAFIPYVVALVAGGVLDALLIASDRAHWQALLSIGSGTGLVAAAALGYALALSPAQVMAVISLVGVLRLVVAYGLVHRAVPTTTSEESGDGWRVLLGYSRPIALNDAVGALSRTIDRLVILYFFSHETFAEYHFGAVEVPISLLLAAVVTVLVPEISALYRAGNKAAIADLWRQAVTRLALIVLPLFCFLFAFADAFIGWYLPEEYGASIWVFRIFLLALPLRCAVYNPLLVGMGKAAWALWGSLGDLALNAALSVALVLWLNAASSPWAFLGPALATVLATYVQVAFLVALIALHLGWSWAQLLPWAALARFALGGMLAAGIARWISAWGGEQAVAQLMLGGMVFVSVMGGVLFSNGEDRRGIGALLAQLIGRRT